MIDALKLEWLKIKNYKVFWVLLGMYILALIIICFGGMFFLEWLKYQGADFEGIDPTILPIYDFPDIWQNTTYLASFLKIILAFIVIISINNDLSYNTLRQNIIDGVSKKEYVLSKLLLILSLSITSTLVLIVSCLVNGAIYSHVWNLQVIFDQWEFVAAYAYDIIVYCTLALLVSLLIRKTGFVIIAMALYTFMFEPILAVILTHSPYTRDGIWPTVALFMPINSLNQLIQIPFPKFIFREITDFVPWSAVAIVSAWFMIYLTAIFLLLTKRDLK